MTYAISTKLAVQQERRNGESIRNLARQYAIPKSTVSSWCKNIVLSARQIDALEAKCKLAGSAQCIRLGEQRRKERLHKEQEIRNKVSKQLKHISDRDLHMLALGLYWGEGYKINSTTLGFTNSDPSMLLIYLHWLRRIHKVDQSRLIARVSINTLHERREEEIINYWSQTMAIPIHQFTKTSFIKTTSKKYYPNSDTYYGTLRITVRQSNDLRLQTLAAIENIPLKIFPMN